MPRHIHDQAGMLRDMQRRLAHEERRPSVRTASDIMGPGLGPYGIELTDWNQDEATFNGFWYSIPGAANTPDPDYYWAGYSIGNVDGYGIQVVTQYRELDGEEPHTWDPNRYIRRFYTLVTGVHRSYSLWRQLNEQGPQGDPGPPGAGGYLHAQVSASSSWSVAHNLGHKPSVVVTVDGEGRVYTDITDIDDDNLTIVFPSPVTGTADMV